MNSKNLAVPKLLVSVRNAEEVLAALAGGADWIDLKEPSAGPLAAVDAQVAREAVQVLAGRRPLSAALGELRDWKDSSASELLAVTGISVMKLGLTGCAKQRNWQQQWLTVAEKVAQKDGQLAMVIYADWHLANAPAPEEILQFAQLAGCQYLLVDTYDKSAGSTFDHFSPNELEKILREAKRSGMTTVLAGCISLDSIASVPCAVVDMVAVRGAVCQGDRTARIEAERVASFRHALTTRNEKTRTG